MPAQLSQQVGGQVVALILVLGRVGPLFVLAPVFSSMLVAARAKFLAAAGIAFALAPVAAHGKTLPSDPIDLALALVHEVAVGLALALSLGVLAAAIQAGASLLDTLSGFSIGALLDPITGTQNAVFGQLYSLVATLIFVLSGGIGLMVAGVARSYALVPLGAFPDTGRLARLALQGLENVPLIGLEIAAPGIIALVVTDVALGLLTRSAPQLNAFVLGMPAKVLVAFAVVGSSLPFLAPHLEDALAQQMTRALTALQP